MRQVHIRQPVDTEARSFNDVLICKVLVKLASKYRAALAKIFVELLVNTVRDKDWRKLLAMGRE